MLCKSSFIYLFVVFLCRPVDEVAFVYLLFAEPMPLGLVVTDGSSFICVLPPPPPPDYLGRWPRCMWYPFTMRGAPREQPGSSRPLCVFPSS